MAGQRLLSLSVWQPIGVLAVIVVLALIGLRVVSDLPIEAFPDVQDTQVQVVTQAPGQAPEEVERAVSQPIERELAGTPRATRVRSVSISGLSVVTVTFSDGTADYFARQQVLERLQNVGLPASLQATLAPLTNAVGEVFRYVIEVPATMPEAEARAIQDWVVRPQLKTVPGIADIVSFGGAVGEMQVRVDPARLARYGLTLDDVSRAVADNGDNVGAGTLVRGDQAFVIRGMSLYRSADDVGDSVITSRDGRPVRVRDVADVGPGERVRSGIVSYARRGEDGKVSLDRDRDRDRTVEGIVQMVKGGNASIVVQAVRERIEAINERLAREYPGVKVRPIYQRTDLIGATVHTVLHNLVIGAALVLGILYLFLRRVLPALVVAAVIPLALLVAFVGMRLMNVPANLMSLGAVDFGVIIDSAVVLVEALLVKLAVEGANANPGARLRTLDATGRQLAGPILFSKAIIVCAFLPIFGFERVEGRIFTPVALTLSLALAGGLVLTLTLVPALLSLLLRRWPLTEAHLPWMDRFAVRYRDMLGGIIDRDRRTLAAAAGLLALTLAGAPLLGTEFLPKLDEGNIWLTLGISPSSSLEHTKSIERDVRRALLEFPEVTQVIGQVGRPDDGTDPKGPNNLELLADLAPRDQWRYPDKASLVAAMSARVRRIPGVQTNFSQVIQDNVEEALSGAKGEVVAKVFGPDLDVLESKGRRIAAIIERVQGATDTASLPIDGQTEVNVRWSRERLARYGLSTADANRTLTAALAGTAVATFYDRERRLDVTLRFAAVARASVDDISALPVPLPRGDGEAGSVQGPASVPVSELADVSVRVGAARITREAGERHVTVKTNLTGRDLGGFVAEARAAVDRELQLPTGYRLTWGGQFENQQRAMARLTTIVPLAIGAILGLLFFAFRSVRPALLVLSVLPFSLIGGIAGLGLAGLHLSVSAAVGFIAVAGIAVQNGLILIEQVLDNLRGGADTLPAVLDAAQARLRPILMTALMAGLGLLPAALSRGIGAETQQPFAVVIVGGVISGTVATLLLLPPLAVRTLQSRRTRRGAPTGAAASATA